MEEYEEKAEKFEREATQANSKLKEANQRIDELEGQNYDYTQKIKKLEEAKNKISSEQ